MDLDELLEKKVPIAFVSLDEFLFGTRTVEFTTKTKSVKPVKTAPKKIAPKEEPKPVIKPTLKKVAKPDKVDLPVEENPPAHRF